MQPLVTVIISTYNRPDTLVQSLRSVLAQTETRWVVLIVGDGCDERTDEALKPWLEDARFAYVNLSLRCGEQALPNSAAMQWVQTPYLALLNHDDLWLPDHLQTALTVLQSPQLDLYLGRAVMCEGLAAGPDGRNVPVLTRVSPKERCGSDVFSQPFELFEPASAWVIRSSAAREVGPWRTSDALYRVPLQDWLMRSWRLGLQWGQGDWPTCIKVEELGAVQTGLTGYRRGGALHEALMDMVVAAVQRGHVQGEALSRDLELIESPRWRTFCRLIQRRGKLARWFEALLRRPWVAEIYRKHGWDAHALLSWVSRVDKGQWMRVVLRSRTGEAWREPPDLEAVRAQLAQGLAGQPDWLGHVCTAQDEGKTR